MISKLKTDTLYIQGPVEEAVCGASTNWNWHSIHTVQLFPRGECFEDQAAQYPPRGSVDGHSHTELKEMPHYVICTRHRYLQFTELQFSTHSATGEDSKHAKVYIYKIITMKSTNHT